MAARTNKYTSVNFNDIYDQKFPKNSSSNTNNKPNNNSSSSSSSSNNNNNNNVRSKTIISNSRIQGNMLVLTRPTPKPIIIPPLQQKLHLSSKPPDQPASDLESISLRPQGRTGSAPSLSQPFTSPATGSAFKTNKFVPPHLRPGFVGKEEKIVGSVIGRGMVNREIGVHRQGIIYGSSPRRYGENGRPKSGGGGGGGGGGGYERMMRGGVGINSGRGGGYVGGDVDPSYFMNRPGSSGNRPNTSG